MECQAVRGVLRAGSLRLRASPLYCGLPKAGGAAADRVPATDRRLYHHQQQHSVSVPLGGAGFASAPRPRRIHLLAASPLTSGRCLAPAPPQTRTVIISRVIEALRAAELTSIDGLSRFILESAPVTAVSGFYELTLATTGLPCGVSLMLSSAVLQLVFNTPAIVYMTRWMTQKEKHIGDMVAIKAALMRSPSREGLVRFGKTHTQLSNEYGCQSYKLFLTIFYQVVHVTITSFGVRSFLMNDSIGANAAMLPWGVCLGVPDATFILPIVNAALNLLIVEVAAWKKKESDEGLKLTLRRANTPYKPQPLFILNLRRFCTVPLVLIYGIVPSGLTLHWLVMTTTSLNMQLLLTHRQTRRALKIPTCYFETDKPYKDFMQHLKTDVEFLSKKKSK